MKAPAIIVGLLFCFQKYSLFRGFFFSFHLVQGAVLLGCLFPTLITLAPILTQHPTNNPGMPSPLPSVLPGAERALAQGMAVGGHPAREFQPKFPVDLAQTLLPCASPPLAQPGCNYSPGSREGYVHTCHSSAFRCLHTQRGLNSIYRHLIPLNSSSPPRGGI